MSNGLKKHNIKTTIVALFFLSLVIVACGAESNLVKKKKTDQSGTDQSGAGSSGGGGGGLAQNVTMPVCTAKGLGVVDGTEEDDAFPAVVRLSTTPHVGSSGSVCTGTFVSPHALFTAAHCLYNVSGGGAHIAPGVKFYKSDAEKDTAISTTATRAYATGNAEDGFNGIDDFAVLIFPGCVAPAVMGLSPATPATGAVVTIAGFGQTVHVEDVNNSGNPVFDGSKHVGRSKVIDSYVPNNFVSVASLIKETAIAAGESATDNAAPSVGDSGGPLILGDNTISGVLTGGNGTGTTVNGQQVVTGHASHYINIHQPNIMALIDQANADGAGIPIPAGWMMLPEGIGMPTKASGLVGSLNVIIKK